MVTGLPLEHWVALVERGAREVFLGDHTFKRNGGRWQTVTVEDVFIVTQPYGSLLDLAMTDAGTCQMPRRVDFAHEGQTEPLGNSFNDRFVVLVCNP